MVQVKGQPNLLGAFETIIKAAERQRKRAALHGGSSAAGCLEHQVFGGPSGTGKSSSVKVVAKVLASPEVALLKKPSVVTLNKDTDLSKVKGETQPQKIRSFFEKAQGGVLFLDEVHRRPKEFAQALLTPLEEFQGKVMVIIGGYDENVRNWLRDVDPGLPSRFPGRVEFSKLSTDTLVEIGEHRMTDRKKYPVPYSLDPSARAMFRSVMARVSGRTEPCTEPLNARGAIFAVDAMIREHDARDDLDDEDMCITTEDILAACPFAASSPPAATASQHAPATADKGRDGSTSGVSTAAAASTSGDAAARPDAPRAQRKGTRAPAPAAEAAAGGAPRRSSKSQTRSSPAGAAPLSACAAAGATLGSEETSGSEEDAPLSNRPRLGPAPSKSAAPASSGKRKRGEAARGEARAEVELPAVSPEASCLAQAIVKRYDLDKNAPRMTAVALVNDMAGRVPEALGAKLDGVTRVARSSQTLLNDAFRVINAGEGKGDIVRLVQDNQTQCVDGLRLNK